LSGSVGTRSSERIGQFENLPAQPLGLAVQSMADKGIHKFEPSMPVIVEDPFGGVEGVALDPAVDVGAVDIDDPRRHPGLPASAFGADLVLEGVLAGQHHKRRPVQCRLRLHA
jgi:hypothetical protein